MGVGVEALRMTIWSSMYYSSPFMSLLSAGPLCSCVVPWTLRCNIIPLWFHFVLPPATLSIYSCPSSVQFCSLFSSLLSGRSVDGRTLPQRVTPLRWRSRRVRYVRARDAVAATMDERHRSGPLRCDDARAAATTPLHQNVSGGDSWGLVPLAHTHIQKDIYIYILS